MKTAYKKTFTLVLGFLLLFQASMASAYSYGKPDEEDMANVYTIIYAELQKATPDWAKISTSFETVKEEIANPHHFGANSPKMVSYFESKIANKNKNGIIPNFQALLVLNIERRLKFVEESFTDYSRAKLILAKGYATFRELKPTVGGKLSSAVLADLEKSFNIINEEALGNPGLFGVGKKESNKALFDQHQNKILNALKPSFPLNLTSAPQKGVLLQIGQSNASINGKSSKLDAAPYIKSNRTYVPLRFISEAFGAKVTWAGKSQTVTVVSGKTNIKLTINQSYALKNGAKVNLDAPAEIRNGRTFVPVRFISEVLGYKVNWNASTKTVNIQ